MLRRSIGLAVLGAATAAAPAFAKGPDRARVCGAGQCLTIRGERAVSALFVWESGPFNERAAPRAAPYYSIRITGGGLDIHWRVLYVPSRHALWVWQNQVPPYRDGVGPYWRTISVRDERVYRQAVGTLRPLPAPRRWG